MFDVFNISVYTSTGTQYNNDDGSQLLVQRSRVFNGKCTSDIITNLEGLDTALRGSAFYDDTPYEHEQNET